MNWFHIFFRKVCSCCTSVYCHIKRYVKNPIWCNLFTLNASLQGCIYTWILSLNTHNLKSKPNSFVETFNAISKSTFFINVRKPLKLKNQPSHKWTCRVSTFYTSFLYLTNVSSVWKLFMLITPMIVHFLISDELSLILRGKYYNYQRKESNLEFSHTIVMHFFVT